VLDEQNPPEQKIEFKSIDLMWLFSVDLINSFSDIDKYSQKIFNCGICEGFLKVHNLKERLKEKTMAESIVKNNNKAIMKKNAGLLELFKESELLTLDEEYIESKTHARFILKGIKIKLSISEELYDCNVLLTISNLGVGVFTFWTHIEADLNSKQLAKLQILPKIKEKVHIQIPIELLEENSYLNEDIKTRYEKEKNEIKTHVTYPNIEIGAVLSAYWYAIINIMYDRKFKSNNALTSQLRYKPYWIFPFIIINSTNPEYRYADELIINNPKQIFQILTHIYNFDYIHVTNSKILEDTLEPNVTERRDIAYLDSLGSVLLIFSSETTKIIEKQLKTQNSSGSIEKEFQKHICEVLIILEILQIERLYLNYLTFLLRRPIVEMDPRELSLMRSYLSKALDIFYGNVTGNSLARIRLEHGEDVTEIDESIKMIGKKIDLLGEALNSFNTLKTSFFQIAFALILGIVPIFFLSFPLVNPILDAFLAACLTIGIILIFYFGTKLYWKKLKKKDIK
jgi:hypothetical protein